MKKKKKDINKKALLVTEFVFSGKSLRILNEVMQQNNINFDIAAIYSFVGEREVQNIVPESQVFIGNDNPPHHGGHLLIHSRSSQLTGLEKSAEPSAHPVPYEKVLPANGKESKPEQEAEFLRRYKLFFEEQDINKKEELLKELLEYAKQRDAENKKITKEDLTKLKRDIKETRKDIDKMAANIVKKVWNP